MQYFRKFKQSITRLVRPKISIAPTPTSRLFGTDRGTAIDRFYIDKFISDNDIFITGQVIEIGDNRYTKKYGKNVSRSVVFAGEVDNVESYPLGSLLNVEDTLDIGKFDCIICTQVLNFIFDVPAAIEGMHKLLKPNGVALITIAGLCQISRHDANLYGDYWRFTTMSSQRVFSNFKNVEIKSFGNVTVATAFINGLSVEDLALDLFDLTDPDYQVVIAVVATK